MSLSATWQIAPSDRRHGQVWHNDDCFEVAIDRDGAMVRDSKTPAGPLIKISRVGWAAFLASYSR